MTQNTNLIKSNLLKAEVLSWSITLP